ncbi:putative nuclease HARBI1 [Heterodontus francisci]|uniref:putative nuclease HARBI1 n=1 Tax=Heterodontus francisci TaxID=7792 RepID=UPI00355B60ED
MAREAMTHLCVPLNDDLQPRGFGEHPMPLALKMTAALNFYATASFQGPTGDLIGITHQDKRAISFGSITGFQQLQGIIDCTHVTIKAPARRPAEYINRKDFHSINTQLSQLLLLFTELAQMEGWLLGDKVYPLQTWFLKLVRHLITAAEERYNTSHGATRATIEQAIGMLKMRFHCLDRSGGALQYEPERVVRIIAVYCALHNHAFNRGEALQDEERREEDSSSDEKNAEDLQQEDPFESRCFLEMLADAPTQCHFCASSLTAGRLLI